MPKLSPFFQVLAVLAAVPSVGAAQTAQVFGDGGSAVARADNSVGAEQRCGADMQAVTVSLQFQPPVGVRLDEGFNAADDGVVRVRRGLQSSEVSVGPKKSAPRELSGTGTLKGCLSEAGLTVADGELRLSGMVGNYVLDMDETLADLTGPRGAAVQISLERVVYAAGAAEVNMRSLALHRPVAEDHAGMRILGHLRIATSAIAVTFAPGSAGGQPLQGSLSIQGHFFVLDGVSGG